MINIEDAKSKIIAHIKTEFLSQEDMKEFTATTELITTGLIDSISILQLVDVLEELFHIEFEPHEVDQTNLNSVEKILTFIQTKKKS